MVPQCQCPDWVWGWLSESEPGSWLKVESSVRGPPIQDLPRAWRFGPLYEVTRAGLQEAARMGDQEEEEKMRNLKMQMRAGRTGKRGWVYPKRLW